MIICTHYVTYDTIMMYRASEELKVSLTMFKKLCRQYGLTRWPHRQVSSLNKSITKVNTVKHERAFEFFLREYYKLSSHSYCVNLSMVYWGTFFLCLLKHEEKLKGCKEKEHTAQIRAKIVNLKTKRALINKSASAGLNTDVLNAVFAAKPGEVDEMEIIRMGNFSQLANLVKVG